MNTILRFLALAVFAAAGVGIAVCLATGQWLPLAEALAAGDAPPPWPESRIAEPAAPAPPQPVAPRPEYTQQFSAEPPAAQPPAAQPPRAPLTQAVTGQMPSMGQLTELTKMVTDQLNAQQKQVQDQSRAASEDVGPLLRPPAAHPPGPSDMEEEGEEQGVAAPATQQPANSQPSSFKITKLPGEGDDHLSVHIQNKDLREVLDFLGEHGGMSILASDNVRGTVSVSLSDVSIDEALAAILKSTGFVSRREGKFIYVGTPKDMQTAAQSIDRVGTRVYRPNYVKASELQTLITPLLSPTGSVNGGAQSAAAIAVSPPAQTGIPADSTQTGGDSFAQGDVIVVRDYEAVLREIDQLIAEIDRRPLQVAIEAMLLSVAIKDTNSFGVDFAFLRDKQHLLLATGSPLADLGAVSFTDGGLKLGFLDSSLGVFLSALQTIGDTNVIATPRLMCLNKHRAEILIGQQLGYVTKTLTQTTTAQSVEFLQVGTQLRLRPFISSDGIIRMEVHPEISTGTVEVKEGFTLPNKDVTQVTTNIMVHDGCTVVIGGLMQESLATTGDQVPLLGSTPGIGWLFRSRKGTQNRTEIIVLITPHIVYEPEACLEGDKVACDYHRQHEVYKDQMTPLNSRTIGRRFFRMAQNAWANEDYHSAMKFINLAIHFDPQNRAAVDLRSDIVSGNQHGEQTLSPMPNGVPTEAIDGEEIAPWLLDGIQQSAPLHPRDPGQPTRAIDIQRTGNFR